MTTTATVDTDDDLSNANSMAKVLANITLPMQGEAKREPKLVTCAVGPFNLPSVQVDFNQYTPEQVLEMIDWARENGAYVDEERGLFSWRKAKLRDWFILKWG